MNCVTFWATEMPRVNSEKMAIEEISVTLRPNRSVMGPTVKAPRPTPISPTVAAMVRDEGVKPRSPLFDSVGMTAPRTTRSNPSSATAIQHSSTGQKPFDAMARGARGACWLEVSVDMRIELLCRV